MLKSIEKWLNTLEEEHIVYCHWKSNEHLQEALNGDTDLDILFAPSQRNKIEYVFAKCGLKRFRSTPLMQYNAIEDYIGFDFDEAKIWHVHTHYRMTLGESHLKGYTVNPWGCLILRDRIRDAAGIWISEPTEEFILLLCRIALKIRWRDFVRTLGTDDLKEIAWLRTKITQERLAMVSAEMLSGKSRKLILDLYSSKLKNKSQFIKLRKELRKELKTFTYYSRVTSWITRIEREAFWLYGAVNRRLGLNQYCANRRVSPSGGLVVAILGCDGAGKSTTLKYIKKEFGKKLDVVSIYLGSGDGSSSLLRKPMKLVAAKLGGKGLRQSVEKEYCEKKRLSLKSRLYSIAKIIWAVALAQEKKRKQEKMIKARNNGLLVLTDRYPQCDTPGVSDGPLLNRYKDSKGIMHSLYLWEQNIYESFASNPPDITIKLVVPTQIAISRKPEMTVEEIEQKKNIVMKMNISDNTVVIDTSRPFEITRREVMKSIWEII